MGEKIILDSVKKIYGDSLVITIGTEHVVFDVRLDGSRNQFRINKLKLKEKLLGQ